MELALARRMRPKDLADPKALALLQASLLQGIELGRRAQQRKQGKLLALEHLGFSRQDDAEGPVLVCRARVVDDGMEADFTERTPEGMARAYRLPPLAVAAG